MERFYFYVWLEGRAHHELDFVKHRLWGPSVGEIEHSVSSSSRSPAAATCTARLLLPPAPRPLARPRTPAAARAAAAQRAAGAFCRTRHCGLAAGSTSACSTPARVPRHHLRLARAPPDPSSAWPEIRHRLLHADPSAAWPALRLHLRRLCPLPELVAGRKDGAGASKGREETAWNGSELVWSILPSEFIPNLE